MSPSGRARSSRRVALALAALAFALGGSEICARAFAPVWLSARMREVSVGRALASWGSDDDWPSDRDRGRPIRFVPGSRFIVRHDEYLHTAQIDEFGGRALGRTDSLTRPIVPVLGDSMTFGIGVRDDETFVSRLDALLPVRLVNLGMPGSELLDQLESLDRLDELLGAPATCVFVVFLGNDLADIANAVAPHTVGGDDDGASLSDWLFSINRAFDESRVMRRSYVAQWARAAAVRVANARREKPQTERVFELMDRAAPLDEIRAAFDQAADRLAASAIRLRFTPLVVVVPDRYQADARIRRDKAALYGVPLSSYDPMRPNQLVADALNARRIAWIDTTPCLADRDAQYYVRDVHLTAAGHATVAACVETFLRDGLSDRTR
jgi:lysophospholipase L1-like esterase